MAEAILVGLAAIVALGIGAQWLAWRLRIPAILSLLVAGLLAGPATGFLDPDVLLGDLLVPFVSVAVGIVLFEGGLQLRWEEIAGEARTVASLVTVGVGVTWIVGAVAAYLLLGLSLELSLLLGAVLVVTGPTVILPILRHIRPTGQVGSVLKWEGIVIDPIGAMLAVLVFEAILVGGFEAATVAGLGIVRTLLIGGLLGGAGAALVTVLMERHWVPDYLHSGFALSVLVMLFAVSNQLQSESGLLTATVMGIALANQDRVDVQHVMEFKENLSVMLIAVLFVILGARLEAAQLLGLGLPALLFLAVLVGVARPLSVLVSTVGSTLDDAERTFLALMAPRGIVAAAVASLFALELAGRGYPGAQVLVPVTFLVILGTVAIYGLGASPIARRLGVAKPDPQGVLFVGAHPWARQIASAVQDRGHDVLVVDSNKHSIVQAWDEGLPAHHGNILSEDFMEGLDLFGIGKLVALTSNDEVNCLAAVHFRELLDRADIFQLPVHEETREKVPGHLRGRSLFEEGLTYERLDAMFGEGGAIAPLTVGEDIPQDETLDAMDGDDVPLFVSQAGGGLRVFTPEAPPPMQEGDTLLVLTRA